MLLDMNKTAQNTTNSLIEGRPAEQEAIDPATAVPLADDSRVTATELREIKNERLVAIRQAIDKGDYDSEAFLKKALCRMLERLEETENEQ